MSKIRDFGEVFTPDYIVDAMVGLIPIDYLLDAQILDLCAGHGQYTDGIKRRICKTFPGLNFDEWARDHVTCLELQSESCDVIRTKYPTVRVIHDTYENLHEQYDVVFSNPPYQENDGGGKNGMSAKPIYNKILESTLNNLNPRYACFITPSRWMAGGKGLSKFRERMMNDTKIRLIRDFPGSRSVFKNVCICGGVSYFLWDRGERKLKMKKEIWRDIAGYEGLYQISSFGRVNSMVGRKNRFLKQRLNGRGYLAVVFHKDGKAKTHSVHRLIAMAFIPNPDNKRTVNHKNGVKKDNALKNLEWSTYSENNKHAYDTGLNTARSVKRSDGLVFGSLREAARQTPGAYQGNICACCRGKQKTCAGYGWTYA